MSDLFSQPFEEDDPDRRPPPARGRAARPHRQRADRAIRGLLESGFGDVWVEGEISNCRVWNTGHVYFTLKDDSAQIKARDVPLGGALPASSSPRTACTSSRAGGSASTSRRANISSQCEHLEPHGLGALQLAFEQLKKKLQAEGLFDAARKRPLPALPRRIGIVTSLDGAALRDIIKVLRRRHPNAHLLIRPARVQGERRRGGDRCAGSARLRRVAGVDVVIVARGGGSIEDLWAFNEEVVARAIAACPVPVIAAVGHEVDVTIADFVADLRAPTPSAAAELVVAAKDEFCNRIDRLIAPAARPRRAAARSGAAPPCTRWRTGAGWRAGRRAWRCAAGTPRSSRYRLRRALTTGASAAGARVSQALRRRLEARDVRGGWP